MIDTFKNKYFFLSNFYPAIVEYEGLVFENNEAAFQAAKTLSIEERLQFIKLSPSEAKKLGRQIKLRPDWEKVKNQVMYEICLDKFKRNPLLMKELIATGTEELVEGNTWGDKIWGKVDGIGENRLGKILMKVREELKMKSFDVAKVTNEVVNWIRDWFEKNGNGCNAIVGISGGKDSSVVAALCVEALGKDRVIGILMPNGKQNDIDVARKVVEILDIKSIEINISEAVNEVLSGISTAIYDGVRQGFDALNISEQTKVNLPARIRMTTLYAVSQSMNGRVANTCNLSEDWVGYATRYGDAAGDFSPVSRLTTDEVIAIGKYLGLPDELIYKVPSDGLCGKTDEDNLGFSYATLNRYIRTGEIDDVDIKQKIDQMHKKNLFKLEMMPYYDADLPIAIS